MSNLEEVKFVYIVSYRGFLWAFTNKKTAIEMIEKKLHLKKDNHNRGTWRLKDYEGVAEIITLIVDEE